MIVTLSQLLARKACIDQDALRAYASRWPREHWLGDEPAVDLAWLLSVHALPARFEYVAALVDTHGAKLDRLPRPFTPEVRDELIHKLTREQTQWCMGFLPVEQLHEAQRRVLVHAARTIVADDATEHGARIYPAALQALGDATPISSIRSLATSVAGLLGRESSAAFLVAATQHVARDNGKRERETEVGHFWRCVDALGMDWREQLPFYEAVAKETP